MRPAQLFAASLWEFSADVVEAVTSFAVSLVRAGGPLAGPAWRPPTQTPARWLAAKERGPPATRGCVWQEPLVCAAGLQQAVLVSRTGGDALWCSADACRSRVRRSCVPDKTHCTNLHHALQVSANAACLHGCVDVLISNFTPPADISGGCPAFSCSCRADISDRDAN
jgi:hypothetical protein